MNRLIETPKEFPTSGWCKNPSKMVRRYIFDNFNDQKVVRPGDNGLAWNGRSVWKIGNNSSYKEYSNTELERLLPEEHKTKYISKLPEHNSTPDLSWPIKTEPLSAIVSGGRSFGKTMHMHNWLNDVRGENWPGKSHEDFYQEAIDHKRRDEYLQRKQEMEEMKRREELLWKPSYFSSDWMIAADMALGSSLSNSGFKSPVKDEFTQQDTIIFKSKKKRRKLILT